MLRGLVPSGSYTARYENGVLTIASLTGGPVTISTTTLNTTTTLTTATFTVPTPGAGETFTPTLDGFTSSVITATGADDLGAKLLAALSSTAYTGTYTSSTKVFTATGASLTTAKLTTITTTGSSFVNGPLTANSTPTSANATAATGTLVTFTGVAVPGEDWNTLGKTSHVDPGQHLSDVISDLQGQLDAIIGVVATESGSLITVVGTVSGASSVDAAARWQVGAPLKTRIATLQSPVNPNDVWTIDVADDSTPASEHLTTASPSNADPLAALFAGASGYPAGYRILAKGSTLYVIGSDDSTLFHLTGAVVSRGSSKTGVISGIAAGTWTQTVAFSPAGNPAISLGDKWTISVGMSSYSILVTASVSNGWKFSVNGGPEVEIDGKSTANAFLAAALAQAIGSRATARGDVVDVVAGDGTPLQVGPLVEQRIGAGLIAPNTSDHTDPTVVDTNVHYSDATLTLIGDLTPSGETWTLTVDGIAYTYLTGDNETLSTIATGLRNAFTTKNTDTNLQVLGTGATIEIRDTTSPSVDPFSIAITRGNNKVTGVIDIDTSNDPSGSAQVPVVLPQCQWIVKMFPWAKQFFQMTDTLRFTARPMFQLIRPASEA